MAPVVASIILLVCNFWNNPKVAHQSKTKDSGNSNEELLNVLANNNEALKKKENKISELEKTILKNEKIIIELNKPVENANNEEIKKLNIDIDDLFQEKISLRNELMKEKEKSEECIKTIKGLETTLNVIQNSKKELLNDSESLKTSLREMTDQTNMQAGKIKELEIDNKVFSEENSELKDLHKKLLKENNELKVLRKKLLEENTTNNPEEIKEVLKETPATNNTLEIASNKDFEELSIDYNLLKREKEKLNDEYTEYRLNHIKDDAIIMEKNRQIELKNNKIEIIEKENDDLKNIIQQQSNKPKNDEPPENYQTLIESNNNYFSENKNLKMKVNDLENKLLESNNSYNTLNKEWEKLKNK